MSVLPTTTTLSVSANSVTVGTPVVFTATVKDQNNAAVTSGQVKFCDASATYCEDMVVLGTAQLTSAGTATVNLRLGVGSYNIKAVFVGTAADAASASVSQSVTVSGMAWSATTLAVSGVPGNYTLTATMGGGGKAAPTGTVTFEDASNGNATVATATLDATTALATFVGSSYATGMYPSSVAVGDFNGDGKPDLAVVNAVTASSLDPYTVSVLLGNGDGSFQPQKTYAKGQAPFYASLAVGDFNGDGKLDLVATNSSDNTVSVLLGNGDGTFQAQKTYATGSDPRFVAVGDFNGDGKPDLVVTNRNDNTVSMLLGNGDGTFQAQKTYATGSTPGSVAVGDFNGDGKQDLVVANLGTVSTGAYTTVSVLLGNGDGTFQPQQTYAAPWWPEAVVVGDFNGDGKLDLAAASGGAGVNVLLGNGDGTFQPQQYYVAGYSSVSIAAGDFNGDGKLDLAVPDWAGGTYLLLGNGDGTFQLPKHYGLGRGWQAVAVGDFNGDGKQDLAVTSPPDNTMSVLLNEWVVQTTVSKIFVLGGAATHAVFAVYGGDNIYATSNSNTVDLIRGISTTLALTVSPGVNVQTGQTVQLTATLAPTTYNGSTTSGTLTFYDSGTAISTQALSASGQMVLTSGALTTGSHSFTVVYSGDSNFAPATSGDVVVWATFSTTTTLSVSANSVTVGTPVVFTATVKDQNNAAVTSGQVKFCDASATYCQDMAVLGTAQLTSTGTAAVNLRLGVGSYNIKAVFVGTAADAASASVGQAVTVSGIVWSETTLVVSGVPGNYTLTAMVGGGGKAVPTGTVTFEDASNGNATVATATLDTTTAMGTTDGMSYLVGTNPRCVAVGDFNGDGKPDLVVANRYGNTISVLLGNGDGTFQTQKTYATGNQPTSAAVGDFNGDGKLDLVVTNYSDNTVSVLLGNGDGTFQAQKTYATGSQPTSVAIGDFNGDGRTDLVVTNSNAYANTVGVLLGNGDGTFQAQQAYAVGYTPYSVAVGDFNGDGKQDLVIANSTVAVIFIGNPINTVSVLLGNGDGTFQAQQTYTVGNVPIWVSVGDFNGDGKLDLVVTNRKDNTVSMLLGNGNGTFQTQLAYATGAGPTSVVVGDFDGDGVPNFVVANLNDNTVSIKQMVSVVQAKASAVFVVGGAATHAVFAAYGGDAAHWPSTSNTANLTSVHPTTTTLTTSATSLLASTSVTFTATVSSTGGPVPTGSVTFNDGSTTLGSGTLDSTGKATYTTSSLATGPHAITATYSGDTANATSTSGTVTVTVEDFSLPSIPPNVTVTAGQSKTATFTVTPSGGFTGTITFACAVPMSMSEASCSASSVQITGPSGADSTLTVNTTAPHHIAANEQPGLLYAARVGSVFAAFIWFGVPVFRRRRNAILKCLLIVLLIGGAAGCAGGGTGGGGGSTDPGTPVGSYTVTVTATSGSLSHTMNVTVTVQ